MVGEQRIEKTALGFRVDLNDDQRPDWWPSAQVCAILLDPQFGGIWDLPMEEDSKYSSFEDALLSSARAAACQFEGF